MPERNSATYKKSAYSTSLRRSGQRPTKAEKQEAQEKFLKAFANTGNVRAACLQAGIDRSTVHRWNEHDEQFSMQYNIAKEDVNDAIRAEIFRRAMYGEEEPIVSMGKVVFDNEGHVMKKKVKSDILLMFHAKARMPEYRDKQQTTEQTNSLADLLNSEHASLLNELGALSDVRQRQE